MASNLPISILNIKRRTNPIHLQLVVATLDPGRLTRVRVLGVSLQRRRKDLFEVFLVQLDILFEDVVVRLFILR